MLRGLLVAGASLLPVSAPAIGGEIDERPLKLAVVDAFAHIEWTGWDFGEESGVQQAIRPILLTHAGDGSGRIFVPTQQGVVHLLEQGGDTRRTEIFLDISDRVSYDDRTNEEGFLGLAFHPRFAENGEFFVYYTNKAPKHQNVVARFRVSASDPQRADPDSEEILLVLDKPFWNHDGGTLVFGPDGYLYIAVGDGGLANDPFGNGQNLQTLLGAILRIDVDRTSGKLPYAIPADNPFVGRADARDEIWAYGLRNVWRMAFDRSTGRLWAGDVGQDLWEEINWIVRGGNYGWNVREGRHWFAKGRRDDSAASADDSAAATIEPVDAVAFNFCDAADSAAPNPTTALIDPIWEYHHDLGKSITGGLVYRGEKLPELVGAYLYADYVAGRLWVLWVDDATGQVTANREIPLPKPIATMSFGEDEDGEIYFMTYSLTPQCIYRLERAGSAPDSDAVSE